jgi:sulfonate transport system permease protein
VAMITFALIGKLADGVIVGISRPLLRWQDTVRARL